MKRNLSSPSESAATEIGRNEDLIREILLRVPPKYVIPLKYVSKQWRGIITDSEFCIEHAKRNHISKPSSLAFYDYGSMFRRLLFIDVDKTHPIKNLFIKWKDVYADTSVVRDMSKMPCRYVNNENQLIILNACNGLILCCEKEKTYLYVCNPTTKKSLRLPYPNFGQNYSLLSIGLSFDPQQSPSFRIVSLCRTILPTTYHVFIYSSETQSWTPSVAEPFNINVHFFQCVVFWRSKIFWKMWDFLLCYDFNAEKLERKALPAPDLHLTHNRYFGVSCGHFVSIDVLPLENYPEMIVYEMHDQSMDWFVKYRVSFGDFGRASPTLLQKFAYMTTNNISSKFDVLGLLQESSDEDDITFIMWINGKVVTYNMKHKKLHYLYRFPIDLNRCIGSFRYIYQHIDTLTPL